LEEIPGVKIFGPEAKHRGGVVAFLLDDLHAHDISQVLDMSGIAVRAGHHCAQPLHDKFGIASTARASFYLYNSMEEVDQLVAGIYQVKAMFS
jgi:cysteine desulfurase/selenocysteine lyase